MTSYETFGDLFRIFCHPHCHSNRIFSSYAFHCWVKEALFPSVCQSYSSRMWGHPNHPGYNPGIFRLCCKDCPKKLNGEENEVLTCQILSNAGYKRTLDGTVVHHTYTNSLVVTVNFTFSHWYWSFPVNMWICSIIEHAKLILCAFVYWGLLQLLILDINRIV